MQHFDEEAERLKNLVASSIPKAIFAMRFVVDQAISGYRKEHELIAFEQALEKEIHIAISEKIASLEKEASGKKSLARRKC